MCVPVVAKVRVGFTSRFRFRFRFSEEKEQEQVLFSLSSILVLDKLNSGAALEL